MKYAKTLKSIKTLVADYKEQIDKLAQETAENKAEYTNKNGVYTDSYISEMCTRCDINATNKARFIKGQIAPLCDKYFDLLKKNMDSFLDGEISAEIINKTTGIKNTGLKLSQREFDLLTAKAKSYYDLRILSALATEQGLQFNGTNNGYFDNIDTLYKAFDDYKTSTLSAIKYYTGENGELLGTLTQDEQSAPWITSSASLYFTKGTTAETFTSAIESLGALLPTPTPKTTLTEQDKALIDAIIDPKYPSLAKEQVKNICKNSDELAELFALDERYSAYASECMTDLEDGTNE